MNGFQNSNSHLRPFSRTIGIFYSFRSLVKNASFQCDPNNCEQLWADLFSVCRDYFCSFILFWNFRIINIYIQKICNNITLLKNRYNHANIPVATSLHNLIQWLVLGGKFSRESNISTQVQT